MDKIAYKIFIELDTGEVIEAFRWIGTEAAGLERAKQEAAVHGYEDEIECVWAEPYFIE